ncbi:hypothetical protein HaLaN_09379 [Haematococcus lacustris]|uniref:Uncharacterized protein n=1 Tax=Haematococcus lacustris TaxID=44745 RepID=A0A699Z2H9_HAELA|nr:hypothetical protein HaLaN_09379 [Haematococcus lacustris]
MAWCPPPVAPTHQPGPPIMVPTCSNSSSPQSPSAASAHAHLPSTPAKLCQGPRLHCSPLGPCPGPVRPLPQLALAPASRHGRHGLHGPAGPDPSSQPWPQLALTPAGPDPRLAAHRVVIRVVGAALLWLQCRGPHCRHLAQLLPEPGVVQGRVGADAGARLPAVTTTLTQHQQHRHHSSQQGKRGREAQQGGVIRGPRVPQSAALGCFGWHTPPCTAPAPPPARQPVAHTGRPW